MVGKGAFGQAVLYTRKSDGLMSIIKEVNMLDLSANDRQMALNEVKVIISEISFVWGLVRSLGGIKGWVLGVRLG